MIIQIININFWKCGYYINSLICIEFSGKFMHFKVACCVIPTKQYGVAIKSICIRFKNFFTTCKKGIFPIRCLCICIKSTGYNISYRTKSCPTPPIWQLKRNLLLDTFYTTISELLIMQTILTDKDNRIILDILCFEFSFFDHLLLLLTDSIQKNRCRFVIRILWHKFTTDSKVKNLLS